MSKKSKKAERKKKKRQERIRQDKHQRSLTPVVQAPWDDDGSDDDVFGRAMDAERWLRGRALRTGEWVVSFAALAQALQATKALDPVVGPGEYADASVTERAQELAFQCMEEPDLDKAVILARAALEIDATNLDARRTVIIHESDGDPEAGCRRLQDLMDEAGSTLDQALITANEGKLSGLLSARPFMRVLQSLMVEVAQQHDVERLLPVMKSCLRLDRASGWTVIGRAMRLLDEDERWDCAARLRDIATDGSAGRLALDGLLALRRGDRSAARDLLHQAYAANPVLRGQLQDAGDNPMSEMGYEATTIANGLQPLIDDLPDFTDWVAEGMPWVDQATIDLALAAYGKPLSILLDLGETAIDETDYAQDLGIGAPHREQLERILGDPVFHQMGSPESFAPIHAWRALGQIADARSLPALFAALFEPEVGDWGYDELPQIIGRFATALPRTLEEHRTRLADPDEDETQVWALQRILALIAKHDPASRAAVIERLHNVVADPQMNRDTIRASAIACLGDLRAVECLPLIEQAFADDVVDTNYIGLPSLRKKMAGETTGFQA